MALDPNAPFARVYADIPTAVALKLDSAIGSTGKTKKQFIADAIVAAVNALPSNNTRGRKK